VTLILTAIGTILLLLSLAGVAFGIFMATHPRTAEAGRLFAIWWVPGVAGAWGVLMRDTVTFAVGLICFLVAGAVFLLETGRTGKPAARRKKGGKRRSSSARTTKENRTKNYRRAAS
jgi:hypothetical protein